MPTLLVMRGSRFARSIRIPEGEFRIGRWTATRSLFPAQRSAGPRTLNCRGVRGDKATCAQHQWDFRQRGAHRSISVLDGDRLQSGDVELLFAGMGRSGRGTRAARLAPNLDARATVPGVLGAAARRGANPMPSTLPPQPPRAGVRRRGRCFHTLMRRRDVAALITYDALASHFGAAFGEDGAAAWTPTRPTISPSTRRRPTGTAQVPQEPVVLRSDFSARP